MASYFQSYFQASSMPKRLLQYALSRLEILDTDALDLENLDIAWGKNSTFEFKDVGLRLTKLETLIQLPPSFELVKARVLLLKLTIPVDIYSSPILVVVDGVECQVCVKSNPEKSNCPRPRTNHDRIRKAKWQRDAGVDSAGIKAPRTRTISDTDEEMESQTIPTAVDLAQSFLQTEPEDERAELEAAIQSEPQELGTSSVSSDDGEIPMGTGTALTLPAFMARFLQGIIDRLEVRIHGVVFNFDSNVPTEFPDSTLSHSAIPVTIQLQIEDIDIEGVTDRVRIELGDSNQSNQVREGKRLIWLSNIRGALISEPSLFSSLARSSALSSPSVVPSTLYEEQKSDPNQQSGEASTSDGCSSDHGSTSSSSKILSISSSRTPINPNILSPLVSTYDNGRFEDAPEEDQVSNMSAGAHVDSSEMGDSFFQNSEFLDQVTESQFMEDTEKGKEPLSMIGSTLLPARSRFSEGRVSQSQSSLPSLDPPPNTSSGASSRGSVLADSVVTSGSDESDEGSSSPTPIGEGDLSKSQLFSHEDAESMYMSALSHDLSASERVPGGWAESSYSSIGEGPFIASSPSLLNPQARDNLEHARHTSTINSSPDSEVSSRSSQVKSRPVQASENFIPSSQDTFRTENSRPTQRASSSISEQSGSPSEGYSRMRKQLFSLDHVQIYVPSAMPGTPIEGPGVTPSVLTNSIHEDQRDNSESISIDVPGAFSSHRTANQSPVAVESGRTIPGSQKESTNANSDAVEVEVGKLLANFDISLGRLIFRLIQQLKEALVQETPTRIHTKTSARTGDLNIILNIEEVSLRLLERLDGCLTSTGSPPSTGSAEADTLLRAKLAGLKVHTLSSSSNTKTSISLKKFVFGYAQENIISFDGGLQMRTSARDLKISQGIDVFATVTQSLNTTRCELVTLPLYISLDLRRLDETFSWFGGLSGVLNLGSSIASNATITATSPSKSKSRGVRFETPIKPDDNSLTAHNKADVRIGGVILDLVGAECRIRVDTSAVKMVNRDEGLGISLQRIQLSGPHFTTSSQEAAINIEVASTRIEYLTAPKDVDLDRLLSLITPSRAKYDQDDDILLDTLLRQRKQGAVLRVTVGDINTHISSLDKLNYLPTLGEEVARLATVAKYLPEDDRPGLLSLLLIQKFGAHIAIDNTIGTAQVCVTDFEVAQITLPSLIAISIRTISAQRNATEDLIGPATHVELREPGARSPAIMARMIGDEMEPIIKVKLWNLRVEYRVSTLLTILGLAGGASPQDLSASLTASVATLTDFARLKTPGCVPAKVDSEIPISSSSKPMNVDVVMRDCIIGLNPIGLPSKILVVLTEGHLAAVLPKDENINGSMELSKASLLVIDNTATLLPEDKILRPRENSLAQGSSQVADLCAAGYVSVGYISSAKAIVKIIAGEDGERSIDLELRDDLFVLESCADSTQTLIAGFHGLVPPTPPPSKDTKYRTKVIPVHDLLASLSGDAFGTAEGDYNFDDDFELGDSDREEFTGEDIDGLDFDSHYYQEEAEELYEEAMVEDGRSSIASSNLVTRDTHDGVLLESFLTPPEAFQEDATLDFQENHFGTGSMLEGTAHRWNSSKNTYDRSDTHKIRKSPLKVCVRDVHIIWNLFDGYDWQNTRDTITKAVQDVESKAIEKRARNERRPTFDQDVDDDETVIGDFLFNSIYIGIPANRDPHELAAAINQELNDNATETESIATTTLSSSPSRQGGPRRSKSRKLRLSRSKHHKITFELSGVCIDFVAFPSGTGETQSSVDIRVQDFEVFDHVPTSTWRKFATYMQDAGERETGTSMIHIEILNVKPIPDLVASEIVLKATVLPLRLHVDQDALDFITRFFEFKDDSAPSQASSGDAPFLQRVEVNSVQVKLDFKPKRVDYAGLRSGHTTEFMNFLILDGADMILRHTIIYGISGFDKLGKCLNDIWMPEIKRNQLPGILAGLAPVRSIVNVGGGIRQLFLVPVREYKKDGRVARSLSKGATAFARTTGTELVKLGAKVAIGVQTVLQGAEGFLGPTSETSLADIEEEEGEGKKKQISLYANQPVGVMQGLKGGYSGLQRDLLLARDAIIAVPGEAMEGGNAAGVLRAVRKHAPTVILRPAIGVAKASGQILMGATNSLDPVNLQRADAKYKRH